MAAVDDLVEKVRGRLAIGQFPEAKLAVDQAFGFDPANPDVRVLYGNVYMAHGIRLSGRARERRREEIEARGVPGQPFEDSDEVKALFHEMIAAFDRVLVVNPDDAKAFSLKAHALFRLDRANRADALAVYDEAVKALERSLPPGSPALETGRRNLLSARRRIEKPCEWCDDTGFCTECGGGGWRVTLGFRRKCEACLGHGICKRCGVL